VTEIRPPRFGQDTPDRMAARVIAMDALGAWNPVPDDRLTRLLTVHETLRSLGTNPALADTIFDATLAVLVHREMGPTQAATLVAPLLATWEVALQTLRPDESEGDVPLLPAAPRAPRALPRREVLP
jgi:hypothetical protein